MEASHREHGRCPGTLPFKRAPRTSGPTFSRPRLALIMRNTLTDSRQAARKNHRSTKTSRPASLMNHHFFADAFRSKEYLITCFHAFFNRERREAEPGGLRHVCMVSLAPLESIFVPANLSIRAFRFLAKASSNNNLLHQSKSCHRFSLK